MRSLAEAIKRIDERAAWAKEEIDEAEEYTLPRVPRETRRRCLRCGSQYMGKNNTDYCVTCNETHRRLKQHEKYYKDKKRS